MKIKITITPQEAVKLIVESEFFETERGSMAYNGPWTITQISNTFEFNHELATETAPFFELFAPH